LVIGNEWFLEFHGQLFLISNTAVCRFCQLYASKNSFAGKSHVNMGSYNKKAPAVSRGLKWVEFDYSAAAAAVARWASAASFAL
jgi:hypothetical protein